MTDDDELLHVEDLARLMRIKRHAVFRLVRSGRLPARKIGRDVVMRRTTFDAWLDEPAFTALSRARGAHQKPLHQSPPEPESPESPTVAPLVPFDVLPARLIAARQASEWTPKLVAKILGISEERLGRLESGTILPIPRDLFQRASEFVVNVETGRWHRKSRPWARRAKRAPVGESLRELLRRASRGSSVVDA